ncbi:hypothetical protein M8J77_008059 [Diaphorina citri]|nr:hypothetical protein M8J77_008059 [Diaphorina citri]
MNFHKIISKQKLWNLHQSSSCSFTLLPNQAQVVIVGSGVVANSVAYHLVKNGWKDLVLLEQDSLCSGTSSFGSGTLGLFKPIDERNIINYSIKLYKELQDEGYNLNIEQVGSINVAQTKDRMIALRRRMAFNLPTGLDCEVVGPQEIKKLHPYINVTDLEGGVWVPEDCIGNPQVIGRTLASLAEKGGARYFEKCHFDNYKFGHAFSTSLAMPRDELAGFRSEATEFS